MSRFRSWVPGHLIAMLAMGLALAAACGSESTPDAEPTQTQARTPTQSVASTPATATPTPPPELTVEELLSAASERLRDLSTAQITMVDEFETGAKFFGTTFKSLEADLEAPDSFHMVVDVVAPGLGFVEIVMLAVGDEAYMKFSADAPWTPLPADQVPFNLAGIGVTLGDIILAMEDASEAGRESLRGAETIQVDGAVTSEDLANLIRDTDPGHPITLSVWIDEDDYTLRQMLIAGRIFDDDGPETRRLVTVAVTSPSRSSFRT